MLDVSHQSLLRAIFHTLAYSDVFDYPLTAGEVYLYLTSMSASLEEVTQALANETLFARVGEYFTLRGREKIVETRERRAEIAEHLWRKAARYGKIIAGLPFVRMVAVTGSLAMNNTDKGKDIDYMIVAEPGRLWLCRALSLLVTRFAKLEEVSLCPNYLVTTKALEFKERSLYVAHELAQMIPLSGMEIYQEIRRLNGWTVDYLPNAVMAPRSMEPPQKRSMVQRVLEFFFRLPFASGLEKWEMNRKIARLRREQSPSFESYFSADVCKGHIDRHRQKTEDVLVNRLKTLPAFAPRDTTLMPGRLPLPVGEGRGEGE
jgi:hypothetical protein